MANSVSVSSTDGKISVSINGRAVEGNIVSVSLGKEEYDGESEVYFSVYILEEDENKVRKSVSYYGEAQKVEGEESLEKVPCDIPGVKCFAEKVSLKTSVAKYLNEVF